MNPRGSDRQCDIFMRIEPRDHAALATALASAFGLQATSPPPPPSGWTPPIRETLWTMRQSDGTSRRITLVSSQAPRGGNVHVYIALFPRSAAHPPNKSKRP
jgi:hypothetical protein